MPDPLPPRRRSPRGRAIVLWSLAAILLSQAALALTFAIHWPTRDPEFGRRLTGLHARLGERDPSRPLVIVLGSSRTAMNLRPGLLDTNRVEGTGPVVFNFGICHAGPMMMEMTLRRLLDAGVKPDLVLVETFHALLNWEAAEQQDIVPERLRWSDVRAISPEYKKPGRMRRDWAKANLNPYHSHRAHLLAQWAPWLLDAASAKRNEQWVIDGWGWLECEQFSEFDPVITSEVRRQFFDQVAAGFVSQADDIVPSDFALRTLSSLFGLCRCEGIPTAMILLPDPFLTLLTEKGLARLDAVYGPISREHGLSVIDLRHVSPATDFVEGIHLTPEGAGRLTGVFEREVVPHLDPAALARRWPPGRLRPSAEARRLLAALAARPR